MASTANTEGVLVYTNESKGFKYTEGDYELTGNKVAQNGVMTSVEGGSVQKNGTYIGNFYVRIENGTPKISLTNLDASEFIAVFGIISNLLTKLAE